MLDNGRGFLRGSKYILIEICRTAYQRGFVQIHGVRRRTFSRDLEFDYSSGDLYIACSEICRRRIYITFCILAKYLPRVFPDIVAQACCVRKVTTLLNRRDETWRGDKGPDLIPYRASCSGEGEQNNASWMGLEFLNRDIISMFLCDYCNRGCTYTILRRQTKEKLIAHKCTKLKELQGSPRRFQDGEDYLLATNTNA